MKVFLTEAIERKLAEDERAKSGTQKSWIDELPKLPRKAAREVSEAIESSDFRKIDEGMWQ